MQFKQYQKFTKRNLLSPQNLVIITEFNKFFLLIYTYFFLIVLQPI
jgi:hypothetical protein